jgi:beta-lactamase regulating signal transducer with metallopeptidase domain
LYFVLTAGIKQLTASAKHTLSVYMLMAGVCWFVISLSWKYYSLPHTAVYTVGVGSAPYTAWEYARQLVDRLMPWWSALYLICIAALFIKFLLFIREAQHLQQKDISKLPVDWRLYVRKTAALLGIEKEIKAVVSARVDTPQVIGFLKPVILVPLACINYLDTDQLEAVLLHELIHIKRNDYLVNLFVASAEILFFFNPFVKQLVCALRKEREYSCDDMVLQFQYQPCQYASALLSLERQRTTVVTFGIAASGRGQKQLLARVQRIAGMKINQQRLSQAGAYLAVALLLGFIAMVNPVKVVEDKISPALVNISWHKDTSVPAAVEHSYTIVNLHAAKQVQKEGRKKPNTSNGIQDNEDDGNLLVDMQAASLDGSQQQENNQDVVVREQRDFSLPETSATAPPLAEDETPDALAPYVPNNSYSYHFVPDSSVPRIKGETFSEKQAREALSKAKKAMEQINWQRIQHDLKYNKRSLDKLKAEISRELATLDWQQINTEVMEQQKIADMQKTRSVILREQSLRQYQQNETYNEAVRKALMEKTQQLKESEERQETQQQILIDQQKKLQDEMRKKKIVYI